MTRARRKLGIGGESLAARWYEDRGYRVVARNWRTRNGELDLVVGVDESQAELLGEAAADRRLSGAHEADQHDGMAIEALADESRILAERAAGHAICLRVH